MHLIYLCEIHLKQKNQKQLFFITHFDKWMILKDIFLLIFQYLTFFIKLNDDRSKFPHRFFFAWKWQITNRMIHLHVCGKWLFSQGSGALFKGMVTVVKGLKSNQEKKDGVYTQFLSSGAAFSAVDCQIMIFQENFL